MILYVKYLSLWLIKINKTVPVEMDQIKKHELYIIIICRSEYKKIRLLLDFVRVTRG